MLERLVTENGFSLRLRKTKNAFSSKAPTQVSEARRTKEKQKLILRKTKPKRKQRKEEKQKQQYNQYCYRKNCLRKTIYQRTQKYFRTLNSVARCFRTRKTKASTFQIYSFCLYDLPEAVAFTFLPNVTPS